jgi:hypothetical protein
MVANMLHVHREEAEGEASEETRINRDINYSDDIIEPFLTPTKSCHVMKKQVSDDKEVDDYSYSSGNTDYTEPVYEEHMEHSKVRSKRLMLNYLNIISV